MNSISSRVRVDYNQVLRDAFFSRLWGIISGQPVALLPFEESTKRLRIGGPVYRGVKPIRLDQIIGSLNRHHEFDRAFRPSHSVSSERWQSVNRAFYEGVSLPAVALYQVGEVYFVVDGHHRISVARKQGQVFIDAEVREFKTKCNIKSKSKLKDLELRCSGLT